MADFLLELFSEEIPARMQASAAAQLAERMTALLAETGLAADSVDAFVTPRRLAVMARGLPDTSAATREERRGPRADAPEAAIAGFLKSTGLPRAALEERDSDKGRFLFAVIAREGQPAAALLAAHLPALIEAFGWPKSMRWLPTPFRWVRPLRGIVALLDRDIVPFTVQGLDAGRTTRGHRFMGDNQPIAIDSAASWADQLRSSFVIVDAAERRAIIHERAAQAAQAQGLELLADAGLEAENAGLTEWPVPLMGRFDPAFLDVPPEIIQLTMKVNQKYFAVANPDGTLAPAFICTANLEAPDGGQAIVAGNERVLSARLADARFFWEQDKKKPLEDHAEGLKNILFHEKLGTMAEKVERVAKLARWLVETYPDQFPGATPETVERAARLAKADLTTGTVGEFPELQGIIGGYLAEAQGEKPGVVSALRQQYQPLVEGCVPAAVALADRLDTLARFFAADIRPTGSKDPFALRRSALGVIETIVAGNLRLPLRAVLAAAGAADVEDLTGFFADRLKVQQRDAGVRADIVDALFSLGNEDDIVRLLARVDAVQAFLDTEEGTNLLAGFRRAANILKAEEKKDATVYRLDRAAVVSEYIGETEKALARLFAPATGASGVLLFDEADALFAREDFRGAMTLLSRLRAPVDAFFAEVTVNDPDPQIRERRLKLLAGVRDAMLRVADFSKIQGDR